jgi:tRNA-modifying protein YgfZ
MTGYEALRETAAWIDLSARGKIRVTGEDRARLLHAMSTNDIKNLGPGEGVYAFFLSDKGRILADAVIYNLGDSFLLDTEPETADKLREHLDRYIIADDAYLEDDTNRWVVFGIEGPNAAESARHLAIDPPVLQYGTLPLDYGFVSRVASAARDGVRVFLPAAGREKFIAEMEKAGIPQASADEARIVRIENGIPRYGEEITERYLVQETQAMHAVHPNKGCYLGQEIVERERSRGQVHRVLAPIRISGRALPEPGTKLLANGEPGAEIASAVFSPALGAMVGLAYVRTQVQHDRPELISAGEPAVTAHVA